MINEVIDEIIEAERKGAEIIAEAQATAAEIGVHTHAECDKIRAEYALRIKNLSATVLDKAREQAERMAAEQAAASERLAANTVKNAEKNVQRAVEWLADSVMKDVR